MFIYWLTQLLFPNHRSCGIKGHCANHCLECKVCYDWSHFKSRKSLETNDDEDL